jgi:hypothetical protein
VSPGKQGGGHDKGRDDDDELGKHDWDLC